MPKRSISPQSGKEELKKSIRPKYVITTWNVTSWKTFMKNKVCLKYLEDSGASVVILQETKLNSEPKESEEATEELEEVKRIYPYVYFHCCKVKKGYSGTATLSKIKPIRYSTGFEGVEDLKDDEGRVQTVEFEDFYLINTYIPNASDKLKRLDWKVDKWTPVFLEYLKSIKEKGKAMVWGGDINVSPDEIDLARPKENRNKSAGFTDAERDSFKNILNEVDLVEVYRDQNPSKQEYSYFSKRFNCKSKNIGWRVDFFMVSRAFYENNKSRITSFIDVEQYGPSDHVPVVLEINLS